MNRVSSLPVARGTLVFTCTAMAIFASVKYIISVR
jgi:hypothetical protein